MSFVQKLPQRIKKATLLAARGEFGYLLNRLYGFFRVALKEGEALPILLFRPVSGKMSDSLKEKYSEEIKNFKKSSELAVLVHMYYPEIFFLDIAPHLKNIQQAFDMFITVPEGIDPESLIQLKALYPRACVFVCENRGRDIYPFILTYLEIGKMGYEWICKLHTKRSTHLNYGDIWRRDIYKNLLSPSLVGQFAQIEGRVGLIAPEHNLLPSDIFIGDNEKYLTQLEVDFGVQRAPKFIAGSMFWFRPMALQGLFQKGHDFFDSLFVAESGQVDGTPAHALERFFTGMAQSQGYRAVTSHQRSLNSQHGEQV